MTPQETNRVLRKERIREHRKVGSTRHRSRSKQNRQTLCNRNSKPKLLRSTQPSGPGTHKLTHIQRLKTANNRPTNAQASEETKQILRMDAKEGRKESDNTRNGETRTQMTIQTKPAHIVQHGTHKSLHKVLQNQCPPGNPTK